MGEDYPGPANKKPRGPLSVQEAAETAAWVPLDEYYYGKKEGDPAYREEKGEFRFKCWYCHKMLYNNMRIMMHMQGHIDTEKQQNIDLSDITQCKHCYKQFDTPFEMQCHVEKIHQNKSNVLVCRICEKDHESQANLRNHMRNCHTSCEMPYICQLCNFRSSIYSDVVDHFKKRHDSSQYLMCLYCLKVFKVNFSKTHGWGLTQNYYQHLQKHQMKNVNKKCTACKLTYLNKQDAKNHKQKDHMANYKGTKASSMGLSTTTPNQEQVMIKLLDTTNAKANQPKSLNAPVSSKVRELRGLKYSLGLDGDDYKCVECKAIMGSPEHFKKYVECSMCRYATTCSHSYVSHMMGFHSGNSVVRKEISPQEKDMTEVMYCLCGFSSKFGNTIANHMVSCSKRTSYKVQPQQKILEYDDEQEDFDPFAPDVEEPDEPEADSSPSKAGNEMFLGIFGLVKKQGRESSSCLSTADAELTPREIAECVIDDVLDAMFPAEAAAGEFVRNLLDRLDAELMPKDVPPVMDVPPLSPDEVPDDLKEEQETKAPSKPIFGVGEPDVDEEKEPEIKGDDVDMQEKETVKEGVKQTETLAAEEKPVQEQNSEEKMDTDAADEAAQEETKVEEKPDPVLADAKEEPKSDKSQNVKSPEEKPVDVQMRDDLLEEDPGTPVVDEPMETALPAAPQPTESAAEELVKSEQIESGGQAVTNKEKQSATEGSAEEAGGTEEEKAPTRLPVDEKSENKKQDAADKKDGEEKDQTDNQPQSGEKEQGEVEEESERVTEQSVSDISTKIPEETSHMPVAPPSGSQPEERGDGGDTQPVPPESGVQPEEGGDGPGPQAEDKKLPAVPPLIPSAPAQSNRPVESTTSQSRHDDRRGDGSRSSDHDNRSGDYRRTSGDYSRSDSDRYDSHRSDSDRYDRDRDYYRNRDRDYRRDDRGYDNRSHDRRDNYRDRYGGHGCGGGGYHGNRGYDDYRHGGGYDRRDNRQGGGGGGYYRDNRRGGRGGGGYYDNRGYY